MAKEAKLKRPVAPDTKVRTIQFLATCLVSIVITLLVSGLLSAYFSLDGYLICFAIFVILLIIFIGGSVSFIHEIRTVAIDNFDRVAKVNTPHVIVYNRSRELYIDDNLYSRKLCRISDTFHIKNNSGQDYEHHHLSIRTITGTFTNIDSYTVEIDGKTYGLDSKKFTISTRKEVSIDNQLIGYVQDIDIMLNIPPDESMVFVLSREVDTMSKFYNGGAESLGTSITHETHSLQISCALSKDLYNKGFYFSSSVPGGNDEFEYSVLDGGKQVMKNYIHDLKKNGNHPIKTRMGGVSWAIPNPYNGYTYKLQVSLSNDRKIRDI